MVLRAGHCRMLLEVDAVRGDHVADPTHRSKKRAKRSRATEHVPRSWRAMRQVAPCSRALRRAMSTAGSGPLLAPRGGELARLKLPRRPYSPPSDGGSPTPWEASASAM